MKVAAAILYAIALVAALTIAPYAEGRFIIRKVSAAVPTLPTTNLVVNLAADGDVYNTGTTQCTDGQSVETWVDAAGTAQNVTASGTDQPTWNAGGGTPYLDFDGNDILTYTSGTLTSGDACTIYAVVSTDDITAAQMAVARYTTATANDYMNLGNTTNPVNGTAFFQVKGATAYTARSSSQLSNSVTTIIHGNNNASDNDRSVYIENAGSGNETTAAGYNHISSNRYAVGGTVSNGTESNNWNGKIYHVLIYDEEHDASERADTIAYLQDKWGL